ncbi:MAG: hypothetical protein U0936_14770 [Planctomycetaceae bacterium]
MVRAETKLTVDQTTPLPVGEHFPIDRYGPTSDADVEAEVEIDNADTTGFVIVDAIQLVLMK